MASRAPCHGADVASWALLGRRENVWRGPLFDELEMEVLYEPPSKKEYPRPGSRVSVHFTGRLAGKGCVFDGSRSKNGEKKPFEFTVGTKAVVPGFERGCLGTPLGGATRVRVPSALAYGQSGIDRLVPKDADLVFDIILVAIGDHLCDDLQKAQDASLKYLSSGLGPTLDPFKDCIFPEIQSYFDLRKDIKEGLPLEDAWLDALNNCYDEKRKKTSSAPFSARRLERVAMKKKWVGLDVVGEEGLCVLSRESLVSPGWTRLLSEWTWPRLKKWPSTIVAQAKQRAPIRGHETLQDVAVIETSVRAFVDYALSAKDETPRFYLNGWDFLSEKNRIFDDPPDLDLDCVDDQSYSLMLQFERETHAVLFGRQQQTSAVSQVVDKTALRASETLTKAFIAPPGAVTRLHRDNHGAHARLTVLRGSKLFVAFPPSDAPYLYVQQDAQHKDANSLGYHSPVDVLNPDFLTFPDFAKATPFFAVLSDAETLLVPKNWWHCAVSLTPSITVMRNFWSSTNLTDLADLQRNNFLKKLNLLKDAGLLRNNKGQTTQEEVKRTSSNLNA